MLGLRLQHGRHCASPAPTRPPSPWLRPAHSQCRRSGRVPRRRRASRRPASRRRALRGSSAASRRRSAAAPPSRRSTRGTAARPQRWRAASTPPMVRTRSASPAGGLRPTISRRAFGSAQCDLREDACKQPIDGVEVWPPIERAEEEDRARIAAGGRRLVEEIAVDAVVDNIDVGLAELVANETGVVVADGDDAVGTLEGGVLEALELPPLLLEEGAFQQAAGIFVIAPPDERIDVVGDQQRAARECRRRAGRDTAPTRPATDRACAGRRTYAAPAASVALACESTENGRDEKSVLPASRA